MLGISIFSSIFIITCYLYAIDNEIYDFSVIIPLGILTFVGMCDDIYITNFKLKFIFQADQNHIHHLIVKRKISHPITSIIIISSSFLIQVIILILTY